MTNEDLYWDAVERRDRSQDGRFYVGVMTTGVYCRPSCPARRPLRRNVRFFSSPQDAEREGLRACLRCRPKETGDPAEGRVRQLCRFIESHPDQPIDLADLAARAGLSRFHVQRTFKAV